MKLIIEQRLNMKKVQADISKYFFVAFNSAAQPRTAIWLDHLPTKFFAGEYFLLV
jgi:hypothetical protein